MAVAVVSHAALRNHALMLGFPLRTKVKCESGLNGYQIWDEWIRENVSWVIETAFDPDAHVKITESAQLIGELKDPWELRCQKFLEGTAEYNTFNPLPGDVSTHVNRQAMQVAISNAMFKYKVDFETEPSGEVVTHNALTVAIFDSAEDSSISYTSEIEVAQLWTTRVLERYVAATMTPILEKRAYANDPIIEESYPWIGVGELTPEEYVIWKEHNLKPEVALDDVPLDIRAIDERESFASSTTPSNIAEILRRQVPESIPAFITPAKLEAILRDKSPADRDYFNDWTGNSVDQSTTSSDTDSSSCSGGSSD